MELSFIPLTVKFTAIIGLITDKNRYNFTLHLLIGTPHRNPLVHPPLHT